MIRILVRWEIKIHPNKDMWKTLVYKNYSSEKHTIRMLNCNSQPGWGGEGYKSTI